MERKRRLFFISNPDSVEVRVDVDFRVLVGRHLAALAAFFVQPNPPTLSVLIVVFDTHVNRRRDSREGVAHEADEGAFTQTDYRVGLDGVEQQAGLGRISGSRDTAG